MIPYDDLVAALQAWRARQGLPVSTQQPAVANTSNGQTSVSTSGSPSSRPGTPPPAPPPGNKRTTAPRMPLPLAAVDTADEHIDALEEVEASVDEHVESALIEESHYENEGDDFAMSFGNNGNGHHHNQTSDETLVGDDVADADGGAGRSHNTREDW
jgi:hypothetical protein